MSRASHTSAALALALGVLGLAGVARAEPTAEERTLAETLFREGKKLMDERRFGDACPKLAESQTLDPGGGTLLNLALCHEGEGRTATAWSELREALAIARRDGRRDREALAEARLAVIEPLLVRATIVVEAPDTEGLAVRRNGALVPRAAWGTPVPIDPGKHAIEASAPGRRAHAVELVVEQPGSSPTIAIPALASAPAAASLPRSESNPPNSAPAPTAPPEGDSTQRLAGQALTWSGLALGVIGAVAGVIAIERKAASDAACEGGCTQEGVDANDAASAASIVANVGLGGGLVLGGVGVVLWLSAPDASNAGANPTVAGGGLRVGGSF